MTFCDQSNIDALSSPQLYHFHGPSDHVAMKFPATMGIAFLYISLLLPAAIASVIPQIPLTPHSSSVLVTNISVELFKDLEELSRIVDISYCVGVTGTGIQKPFLCASRCQDFENFELVTVCTV